MPFLPPNQQRQSTEGSALKAHQYMAEYLNPLPCVYVSGRYLAHQYMAEYINPRPCVCVSGRYLAHQYMAEYINPRPCVYVSGRYLAHQYMAECLVALDLSLIHISEPTRPY